MPTDHATLESTSQANLAETLAKILPKAELIATSPALEIPGLQTCHIAVPRGSELKQVDIDLEKYLPAPRHTVATATLATHEAFLAYVARHSNSSTLVWCQFDPQRFTLAFVAVIDEHAKGNPGWRRHQAIYTPAMSAEWGTWTSNNGKAKPQVEFAEFLERTEGDIAAAEGYPTSAEMMQMATNFEVTSEKRLRSSTRLQSGAIQLEYIDKEDEASLERMRLFERFAIGIPVFWGGAAYRIDARLKHRIREGKASFHYELVRPDRVHEAAAKGLIDAITTGLGEVPMLLGTCAGK